LRYGFVIDHNRCIGCHACTVACKEEHNVPLGVFRTWVKYIEKGEFPHTSRHFGVLRCNHCDDAPCIEICPTRALFRRDDGIVDFDNSRCIGCQSCMQACPYDALYLDPATQTAAKCNFCAHRIEMNLEPACVIVCPTHAISAGDIDDPQSAVSQIIAMQKVAVRKPHKGTRPKLFYTGIEGDLLQPSMLEPQPSHLFAQHQPDARPVDPPSRNPQLASPATVAGVDMGPRTDRADMSSIPPPAQGEERSGASRSSIFRTEPATEAGAGHYFGRVRGAARSTPGVARVVYDVAHPQPWGSIPAFYLWTKSIAAGVLMVAALLIGLSPSPGAPFLLRILAPAAALAFTGLTTLLLIADLHRPERFYYILIKPNPRSWLVAGTWILILYSILAASWLGLGIAFSAPVSLPITVAAAIAGASAAGYSAFLFAQAKGRDLWQSPLFLWHLLAQAIVAGAAIVILLAAGDGYPHIADAADGGHAIIRASNFWLLGGVILSTLMVLGELLLTPFSTDAQYAAEMILHGRLRNRFWLGVIALGTGASAGLLLYVLAVDEVSAPLEVFAALLSLAGLLIFDSVWIIAGQAAPLS
jgi:Fe-S-cluster-containing dehydrogenase component/formate-dependent nitrite reductase membrane component NrfD